MQLAPYNFIGGQPKLFSLTLFLPTIYTVPCLILPYHIQPYPNLSNPSMAWPFLSYLRRVILSFPFQPSSPYTFPSLACPKMFRFFSSPNCYSLLYPRHTHIPTPLPCYLPTYLPLFLSLCPLPLLMPTCRTHLLLTTPSSPWLLILHGSLPPQPPTLTVLILPDFQ